MPTKEDLEAQVTELQEKLYTLDPQSRPTIMKTIETKEADLLSLIQWQIKNLEKETGREFPYAIIPEGYANIRLEPVGFKCGVNWCPYKMACEE